MSSVFYESEKVIADLHSGRLPKGSVIRIQWPSGNSESVRFHGWSDKRNAYKKFFMIGCNMSWDNRATQWYDVSSGVVSLVETPKSDDERWKT